jgi:molybdopterin-guanine dinucleotide biosynthesis protein A
MRTIAIQAGGQSRRMGSDKALVTLGGKPMIEALLARLAGLADEILITTNRPDNYSYLGLRLASDPVPGAGALHGLRTALAASLGETVLVLACDLPFISRPLLEHLLARAHEADVIVPYRNGEFEPLHAVYARSVLPAVEAALATGRARMISFFSDVHVLPIAEDELRRFDPEGLSFFNVNTPQDLTEAEALLARLCPPGGSHAA